MCFVDIRSQRDFVGKDFPRCPFGKETGFTLNGLSISCGTECVLFLTLNGTDQAHVSYVVVWAVSCFLH